MNSFSRRFTVSLAAIAASVVMGCDRGKQRVSDAPATPAPAEQSAVDVAPEPPKADAPPAASVAEVAQEKAGGVESLPAATLQKIDAHLVQALQKRRGAPAPGQIPQLDPDVPIQDGVRVLVEIKGTVSRELLDQVALLGGKVIRNDEAANSVRAMVPFAQLGTLAGRADIESISPGTLSTTNQAGVPATAPAGAAKAGP